MSVNTQDVRVILPLQEIEQEVRAEFDRMLGPIAERVAAEARATSAFADKTGKLRKSIKARKSKFQDGGWIVVARSPHAHLVEFGHTSVNSNGLVTGSVPAHPFLRPARDRVARSVVREIRARMGGAYDERG